MRVRISDTSGDGFISKYVGTVRVGVRVRVRDIPMCVYGYIVSLTFTLAS